MPGSPRTLTVPGSGGGGTGSATPTVLNDVMHLAADTQVVVGWPISVNLGGQIRDEGGMIWDANVLGGAFDIAVANATGVASDVLISAYTLRDLIDLILSLLNP